MKKTLFLLMLLLSTSMAMAQFGRIEDLGKKVETGETGGNNGGESDYFGGRQNKTQLIDQTLCNAFMLISQEYQVEDSALGVRYNWGQDQWFGKNTSFIVRLTDGFITTKSIVVPHEDDKNFLSLQGTFYPRMSKTSVLRVGDSDWQVEKTFNPEGKTTLANDLRFVTDSQWGEGGLPRATGIGKKNVYVVWMEVANGDPVETKHVVFKTSQTVMDIVEGKNLYDLKAPNSNGQVLGGIVLEATTDGMGQLSFALLGVAVKIVETYQMALLDAGTSKEKPGFDHVAPQPGRIDLKEPREQNPAHRFEL